MLKLIDSGMTREQAYDLVQPLTKQSWDKGIQFRDLVEGSKPITDALNEEQINDAFDYHYHIRHVDEIFARVGLD